MTGSTHEEGDTNFVDPFVPSLGELFLAVVMVAFVKIAIWYRELVR